LSQSQKEADAMLNEKEVPFNGEPVWFRKRNALLQLESVADVVDEKYLEKGFEIRELPLFLYEDGLCFPTGIYFTLSADQLRCAL
jgi:hypothetical protein